jgi:SAM-dependent methyltransferase
VVLPRPDDAVHNAGPDPEGLRGQRQLAILVEHGLRPEDDLLDIGCGTGRLAYECAGFLTTGTYTGIDVSRPAIDWLRANYTTQQSNLRFDHLDVQNDQYPTSAQQPAESARFPYPAASFDVVCSFAVFMHLLPSAIGRYLAEIRRVLRPHGWGLVTLPIVVDPNELPFVIGGEGDRTVPLGEGVYAPAVGHHASMAFDRELVARLCDEADLHVAAFVPHLLGSATACSDQHHLAAGGDALVFQIDPVETPASWR